MEHYLELLREEERQVVSGKIPKQSGPLNQERQADQGRAVGSVSAESKIWQLVVADGAKN